MDQLIPLFIGLVYWVIGLIGMFRTKTIKIMYGSVISGYWGVLRLIQQAGVIIAIIFSIFSFLLAQEARAQGYTYVYNKENILWLLIFAGLTVFMHYSDKRRFYNRCDKKTAKKLIWNELMLGCSALTRFSLIFFIASMAVVFVVTDTSEYYEGKDGKIYRVHDYNSL